MRDSFVFYKSFREAIKKLPYEEQLEAYNAIFDYVFDDIEVEDGIASAMLLMAKPQIDVNNQRYENGLKGGRPKKDNQTETESKPSNNQTKTKPKPNNNQAITKPEPNVNDNDNVNDNVKDLNLSCAKDSHEADTKTIDERKKYNFEIIYKAYPKKVGKQGALDHYLGWISKKGRCINGKYRRLTNEQIFAAVKKYVKQMQDDEKDLQYYQGFDRFMNKTILDYLEEETNDTS